MAGVRGGVQSERQTGRCKPALTVRIYSGHSEAEKGLVQPEGGRQHRSPRSASQTHPGDQAPLTPLPTGSPFVKSESTAGFLGSMNNPVWSPCQPWRLCPGLRQDRANALGRGLGSPKPQVWTPGSPGFSLNGVSGSLEDARLRAK